MRVSDVTLVLLNMMPHPVYPVESTYGTVLKKAEECCGLLIYNPEKESLTDLADLARR